MKPLRGASKSRKPLSIPDLKRLWGKAGGRCSYCFCQLNADFPETNESVNLGEHAHVQPHSQYGPRGLTEKQDSKERRIDPSGPATYENSILLCGTHHTLVDGAPIKFNLAELKKMKEVHERKVADLGSPATAGYNLEVKIKEASRQVGTFMAVVRRSRDPRYDVIFPRNSYEPPEPRVKGIQSGPPQTVFDISVVNKGTASVLMKHFKLAYNGIDLPLQSTSILHNQPEKVFAEPLESLRAQVITVKAHHVAKWLRDREVSGPVVLTFSFIDVCNTVFSADYAEFEPAAYEMTPDSVTFEEW